MTGRPCTLAPAVVVEFCRRYEAGDSSVVLAREAGMTKSGMCRLLKRHGVQSRSFAEAAQLRESLGRGQCRRRRAS